MNPPLELGDLDGKTMGKPIGTCSSLDGLVTLEWENPLKDGFGQESPEIREKIWDIHWKNDHTTCWKSQSIKMDILMGTSTGKY